MRPRTRTAPLRVNADQARLLLAALVQVRPTLQDPETADRLAPAIAATLPDDERSTALHAYNAAT